MACGKCNNRKCRGCKDAPLSTVYACGQNANSCPTPDVCDSYYYLNCGIYTGPSISCQGGVIAEEGDRLNVIMQRMVQAFCAARECCTAEETPFNNEGLPIVSTNVQGAIEELLNLMPINTQYTLVDNGDGTFSLVDDNSTVISVINKAYLQDNGDGTFTFDNGDGNPITFNTNCCSAFDTSYDNSSSGLSATNVQDAIDEIASTIDEVAVSIPSVNTYNLIDNGDGTFALEENGSIIVPNITKGSLVDNGNGSYTYDNGDGAPVTFSVGNNNIYTIVDNANGSFSLEENGVAVGTINKATLTNNGSGSYTFDNGDGNPITFNVGGTLFYSVTKAQLDTHIANSTLVEGATYWINDRGDVGLFFKAVSTNWLDFENGYRIMRVPIDYNVIGVGANTMHGIWQNTLSVVAGDYVIWGGKVWENLNGNIGAENDQFTLDSEWQLVAKTDNNVYKNFGLGCNYDYNNDWIAYCWDNRGNRLGASYEIAQSFGLLSTLTDFSDWNAHTIISGNECMYICNNTSNAISNNYMPRYAIVSNSNNGNIYNNSNKGNIAQNSNTGNIHSNSNNGQILGNTNQGSITYNSNNGNINNNANSGQIYANDNSGSIVYNQLNVEDIRNNSNNGIIDNNSNEGSIENNANDGFISANENNGNIAKNRNNGTIAWNTTEISNIYKNINNGDINNNDNQGHIQMNSNNGAIVNANNSVLEIENNTNNGIIDGTSLSGVISDPVVDKI